MADGDAGPVGLAFVAVGHAVATAHRRVEHGAQSRHRRADAEQISVAASAFGVLAECGALTGNPFDSTTGRPALAETLFEELVGPGNTHQHASAFVEARAQNLLGRLKTAALTVGYRLALLTDTALEGFTGLGGAVGLTSSALDALIEEMLGHLSASFLAVRWLAASLAYALFEELTGTRPASFLIDALVDARLEHSF